MLCKCGKEIGNRNSCWSCGRIALWIPSKGIFEMRRRRDAGGVI